MYKRYDASAEIGKRFIYTWKFRTQPSLRVEVRVVDVKWAYGRKLYKITTVGQVSNEIWVNAPLGPMRPSVPATLPSGPPVKP